MTNISGDTGAAEQRREVSWVHLFDMHLFLQSATGESTLREYDNGAQIVTVEGEVLERIFTHLGIPTQDYHYTVPATPERPERTYRQALRHSSLDYQIADATQTVAGLAVVEHADGSLGVWIDTKMDEPAGHLWRQYLRYRGHYAVLYMGEDVGANPGV